MHIKANVLGCLVVGYAAFFAIGCSKLTKEASNERSVDQGQTGQAADAVQAEQTSSSAEVAAANDSTENVSATSKCAQAGAALADPVPTYEGAVKGIYDVKCAGCHSATAKPPRKPYYTSYDLSVAATPSGISEITSGSMPPKNAAVKLAAGDLAAIKAWAAGGYPKGTPPPPPTAATKATYGDSVAALLKARCTGCHMAGATAPNLASYDLAKLGADRSLVRIEAGTMPPAGKLADAEIVLFKAWVTAGEPLGDPSLVPPPLPADPATTAADSSTAVVGGTGPCAAH